MIEHFMIEKIEYVNIIPHVSPPWWGYLCKCSLNWWYSIRLLLFGLPSQSSNNLGESGSTSCTEIERFFECKHSLTELSGFSLKYSVTLQMRIQSIFQYLSSYRWILFLNTHFGVLNSLLYQISVLDTLSVQIRD